MQYERQFGPALYPKPQLAATTAHLKKHTPPANKKEPRPSEELLDAKSDAVDGDEDEEEEASDGSEKHRESEVKAKCILALDASNFWFDITSRLELFSQPPDFLSYFGIVGIIERRGS